MENILFFPIWSISPHFETDMEIIINEIEAGNNIYFLFCKKDLKICDNKLFNISCNECIKIRKRSLKIVNSKNPNMIKLIQLRTYSKKYTKINFPYNVNDIKSLHELRFDSYDIGYAIASSLAEELDKTSFFDCREKIAKYYSEAVNFYKCIKSIVNDYKITKGYVFNARYCFPRAFFRAFLDNNITVYTHDRGSTYNKYGIVKNNFLHDIDCYIERVNELWDKESDAFFKKNIADVFFKEKYLGKETDFISFTAEQKLHKLPDEINKYKKIIVIFNSSDFEYNNVGKEFSYNYYLSQEDGISKIVESLKNDKDIGIFLREHPNQKNRVNSQRESVRKIKSDNYYLIPAESDISSYKLLLNANVVITFNSTMGIEATYWGIPSILCANAMYEKLNIAYKPKSHEEVIKLIKSELKPIISDGVYKYGYYHSIFGVNYKYYKPLDLFHGLFLGMNIYSKKYYFDLIYLTVKKIMSFFRNRFTPVLKLNKQIF
jgi:hypothetical protein